MKSNKSPRLLTPGDTICYEFDEQMGFWGVPDLRLDIFNEDNPGKPIHVSHNAEGNRSLCLSPDPSGKTILCLGGSHTWGAGVSQDLRYTEHLAAMSGRQVINSGHCSLGLDQICLAILQRSEKYRPNIIVIEQYPWAVHRVLNNYVNGFVRPYFFLDEAGELRLKKVPSIAKYKFFRRLIGAYYSFRKEFREFQAGINIKQDYDARVDPIFLLWKTRQYDSMYLLIDKIIEVMAGYCRQNNIKLIFCLGAILQQFGPAPQSSLIDYLLPRNRFIELLDAHGISYVDMTKAMISNHSEADPVIFQDGHINAKGHYIFAKTLHEDLVIRGWLS